MRVESDITIQGNGYSVTGGGELFIVGADGTGVGSLTLNDLHLSGGTISMQGESLNINNSSIKGVGGDGDGGALHIRAGSARISRSEIAFNFVNGYGGAIYMEGGDLVVDQSVIANNTAVQKGGAIYVAGGSVTLRNSTVSGNRTNMGGAIHAASGAVELVHVTVADNTGSSEIHNDGNAAIRAIRSVISSQNGAGCTGPHSPIHLEYSIVRGDAISCPVTGDFFAYADPLLGFAVDVSGAHYTLMEASPARNLQDRWENPCRNSMDPTDQLGVARIPSHCDAGAVEYFPKDEPCPDCVCPVCEMAMEVEMEPEPFECGESHVLCQSPQPDGSIVHVVRAGDTIYGIGRAYGVSPAEIVARNRLRNPSVIYAGLELLIHEGRADSA